ncbi:MAG TPA: hypothetical protein VFY78_04850 [Gammaproteobacteria bacterium]|nr:hypothetical protein [Gammaproteobacteria bacterium]
MTRVIGYRLFVSALAVALLAVMYTGWLDNSAKDYTEQGLKRVLVTYAVARGLNGLISVAQGTEVSVEPVGIGMTFTPGQILDPVNDLIEQFSWLVLASGVSLGIQRLLIVMTGSTGFTILVSVMVAGALAACWWQKIPETVSRVITRIAVILLMLRLVIPVIALLNQAVYWYFLQPQYESSQTVLEQSGFQLQQQQPVKTISAPPQNEAMMDKLKRAYQSATDAVDIDARLDRIKQVASNMSERILDLMVVFLVQSLLFPLLFIWLAYRLLMQLLRLT